MKQLRKFGMLLAGASMVALSSAAMAQDSDDGVETVVVTAATRRSESILKVPTAVSAFDTQTIKDLSPKNLEDLLAIAPNVVFYGNNSYRPQLTVRGIQGSNEDAAIAMYVDGVYVGREIAQNVPLVDPQSVEVLRGPQGALYGKNTLGGAIIVTQRKPSFTSQADISLKYGSYNYVGGYATVTGPLMDDKLAGLLTVYGNRDDGSFKNTFLDKRVNEQKRGGARAALTVNLANDLTLEVSGDYLYDRSSVDNIKAIGIYAPAVGAPYPAVTPDQVNFGINNVVTSDMHNNSANRKIYGARATLTWETAPVTFTSVTGYRGYHINQPRDVDGTGVFYEPYTIIQSQHQFSEELTAISTGDNRFNWIAGIQYFEDSLKDRNWLADQKGTSLLVVPPIAAPVIYQNYVPKYDSASGSFYVQADYAITDRMKLATGVRYSIDHRTYDKTDSITTAFGPAAVVPAGDPKTKTWYGLLPEASLNYQFTDNISGYVKVARTYRPGGFNVSVTLSPNNLFNRESATAYEASLKGSFLDGRLLTILTAYDIEWKNQQFTYLGTFGFLTGNVNSRSRGIEFDGYYNVTDDLKINAGFSAIEATFGHTLLDYTDPVTRAGSKRDPDGTPLLYAPKYTFTAGLTDRIPLEDGNGILLKADLAYRSSLLLIPMRKDIAAPAITRVNLRVGYETPDWSLTAFVTNLLDQQTYYYAQSGAQMDDVGLTEPRLFGVEFKKHFE